jgi:heptosyltransferase-1
MRRLLIIKTSSLGDVVHNLPAVSDILAHAPSATIDWVVEAPFADIPLAHPGVRRVIPVALRRWRRRLWRPGTWREIAAFKRALQAERYDVVLDTQGLLKSALLARLAHGPGYGQDRHSAREPLASLLYARRLHVVRGRHAVVRNRDLAAQALGYTLPAAAPDYGLRVPSEGLPEHLRQPYVLCLHGSSRDSKLWPKPYWMSLAKELLDRALQPVFPWGHEAERVRALAIAESAPGALVLPQLPLRRLMVVLERAHAVVGVDTGLVHLAAALARPTVALYTDTSPRLTGIYPADDRRGINLGDAGRIPTPAEVCAALEQLGVLER